jgi:Ion channel
MSDAEPASGRAHPLGRRRPHASLLQRISDAYGLVLVLVLTTYVAAATLSPEGWVGRLAAVAIAGGTAIVAFTSSHVRRERARLASGAVALAIIAALIAGLASSETLLGIAFVIDGGLLAVAAATILRRVLFAAEVSFRTILGAVSVYALLGLLFGLLFLALGRFQGGDAFTGVAHAQARDYLFFSYTTLTSTGYGNLVPSAQIGQILAVLEMLSGQIFLVTLVAGLVSLWRPGSKVQDRAQRRGVDPA